MLSAQSLDWRRVGTTVLDLSLASPAGGPVERVWYSPDGARLFAKLPSGETWQTSDFEKWEPANSEAPERVRIQVPRVDSVIGGSVDDLAASPRNPEEISIAAKTGVWRSLDGGASWIGLNEGLASLKIERILPFDGSDRSIRIASGQHEFIWRPGERNAWKPTDDTNLRRERALRSSLAAAFGQTAVTAAAEVNDIVYAGGADGRLYFSRDRGANWSASGIVAGAAAIERIVVDPKDSNFAVAISQSRGRGRILRTNTGGVFWEDITGNLPSAVAHGIAFDRPSAAIYVATDKGLYFTYADTQTYSWTLLRPGSISDVALDSDGNQIYTAVDGTGLFAALAPHRFRDPKVVSSADRVQRSAAPGSLLSVLGAKVQTARIGDRSAPVLAATDNESQIQVPFDATGSNLQLATATGARQIGLTVLPVSPSIFVDRDGIPLVMNAETGLVLDPSTPARSGARLQILATGLGRISPDWPTGLPAPIENTPRVTATVRAYLDREPMEVTRAVLAPGYIGMYLIEVQLPSIVNRGTSELFVEADNQPSNRVRIFLEP